MPEYRILEPPNLINMKNLRPALLSLLAVAAFSGLTAQLHTTLVGQLGYESGQELSDIWGYVAPNGTEYALVGLYNGISIVSLADPANPVEVVRLPGQNSPWRDLKTFGTHAYVVADQSSSTEGMTIIDLSDLPLSATQVHLNLAAGGTGTLQRAHNIYIDAATGRAYTTGGNLNGGAPVIFDILSVPGSATFVANTPGSYSHDVYVRDGIMYTSNIYAGEMRLYNVSNPLAVSFLGSASTPNSFTHNAWPNDAGTVVFTTDEKPNSAVAAYDISDLGAIEELDQFRPLATLGTGVIPHNVHVLNDYIITSHYTSGLVVIDGSRPQNLIEVANYDTWFGGNGGYNGNWGAYPFLPSGLVIMSDIQSGLYVVSVDYQRACWLEGVIKDESTGFPLSGVTVDILAGGQPNALQTDGLGRYESGLATSGTFMVRISKSGYVTKTVPALLVNGEVTFLNETLLQIALPVELLVFSGQAVKSQVRLDWVTTRELDADYFVIEHAPAGGTFSATGRLSAAGTTDLRQEYTFLHPDPLPGTNLYRLRQVDTDGAENLSPIVSVRFESPAAVAFELWPTPATEWINIQSTLTDFTVELTDATGRRVAGGKNIRSLAVGRLPAGTYQLVLRSSMGELVGTERVVIAR